MRTTQLLHLFSGLLPLIAALGVARVASAEAPDVVWQRDDQAGALAFSSDGAALATAGSGVFIHVRRAADGALIRDIRDRSSINSVAFSPDGQLIADGRTNGTTSNLRIFRVSDGVRLLTLQGHQNATRSVTFSPDGMLIASGGDDRNVKIWRASDGLLLRTMRPGLRVRSVAISPNGALLASGDTSTIKLWRIADGVLLRTLGDFHSTVMSVAFSPDGTLVAGGSLDGTIGIFSSTDGALRRKLTLPGGETNSSVSSVAFSRDGSMLLSGNDEVVPAPEHGTVRFWRVSDGALLHLIDRDTGGVFVSAVTVSPSCGFYAFTSGIVTVALTPR